MGTLLNGDLLPHLPLLVSLHYLGKHEIWSLQSCCIPKITLIWLAISSTEKTHFRVHDSKGSAETLARRGGITNYCLIAYSFSNTSAKNYQDWLMCID